MLSNYLAELEREDGGSSSPPEYLAKTAGVRLPQGMCPLCGNEMVKTGALLRCSCGMLKFAGIVEAPPNEMNPEELEPSVDSLPTPPSQAAAAIGSVNPEIEQPWNVLVEARRRNAAAMAQKVASVKEKVLGDLMEMQGIKHYNEGDQKYTEIPTGRIGGQGLLPTGPMHPEYKATVLPGLGTSPVLGMGRAGLQWGVRVRRKPEGVPAGSVVGKGLNQQQVAGGTNAVVKIGMALRRSKKTG